MDQLDEAFGLLGDLGPSVPAVVVAGDLDVAEALDGLGLGVAAAVGGQVAGAGAFDGGHQGPRRDRHPPAKLSVEATGELSVEPRQQLVGRLEDRRCGPEVLQHRGTLSTPL
ncbi:MAG: hypothetical protein M0Z42_22640 [Actinomycetota bacterium]|nr:hypothetical protein [Actinomycetota bacterium]